MVGSCSSGSSGPSPKTSCSTSSLICCFSEAVSSVGSCLHDGQHRLPHLRADPVVVDAGQSLQVDLVEQLAVQRELELLVLGLQGGFAGGIAQQPLFPAGSPPGSAGSVLMVWVSKPPWVLPLGASRNGLGITGPWITARGRQSRFRCHDDDQLGFRLGLRAALEERAQIAECAPARQFGRGFP